MTYPFVSALFSTTVVVNDYICVSFKCLFALIPQKSKEMDEFRKKLQSLRTESENIILVNTGVMQRYQLQLERIKNNVKVEEKDKLQRENKAKHVSREGSQSSQSIKNLFGRCVSTMRIKPVFSGNKDTASAAEMLDYELDIIKMRISDLLEISKDYKISLDNAPVPQPPNGLNNDSIGSVTSLPNIGTLNSKSVVSK